MTSLLVLNGPNLNLLGKRQPEVYGSTTLNEIEAMCQAHATLRAISLSFAQSNHEGVLIDAIHEAGDSHDGLILNAGAYTHSSIGLMDAIQSVDIPTVELHLSNTHARESFRHKSFLSKVAVGIICGFGPKGYILAIDAIIDHLDQNTPK